MMDEASGSSIDSLDTKKQIELIKQWPNINNCKEYAPFFIIFLDCVHQLIEMNPFTFEFTNLYLSKIAFESMTNKYFEMCSPITDNKQLKHD
jgi:hypothetical protein